MPKKDDIQASFPARARTAKKKAKAALAADEGIGTAHKPLTLEERGGHQKAIRAADRVLKRMGKEGKSASRSAATQPGKPSKGGLWAGVKALLGLTRREQAALDGVEKKTRK